MPSMYCHCIVLLNILFNTQIVRPLIQLRLTIVFRRISRLRFCRVTTHMENPSLGVPIQASVHLMSRLLRSGLTL